MLIKTLNRTVLVAALAFCASAQASLITGDVTGGGTVGGSVDSNDGWISEAATGNGVDFWTLTGQPGDSLSIEVTGDTSMGLSLYQGEVDSFSDELAFSNAGDFADLAYVEGNNPFYGPFGFLDTKLSESSVFTIAVGGVGDGYQTGSFDYEMSASQVPEPSALFLMAGSLGLLAAARSVRPGRLKPELA